ncbi:hypothetical protein PVK06_018842 [Gossypium arboreum]|uniref:Uncharacterized protein n=1 Tax=Gossypium arboreum TaxID=29729 RepID=A0ABR0PIH3_GOSAR|nr:hypothetical protein PVK06_018842 [Gossypium arboreum]
MVSALIDVNLENGNNLNECQRLMELKNEETKIEYVPNQINLGAADDTGKGKERAIKDVRDMGLDIVEVPLDDPKVGRGDIGLGMAVGCRNADINNRMRVILREANNTWAIGKKLRFSVHGNEEYVIEETMRVKIQ